MKDEYEDEMEQKEERWKQKELFGRINIRLKNEQKRRRRHIIGRCIIFAYIYQKIKLCVPNLPFLNWFNLKIRKF